MPLALTIHSFHSKIYYGYTLGPCRSMPLLHRDRREEREVFLLFPYFRYYLPSFYVDDFSLQLNTPLGLEKKKTLSRALGRDTHGSPDCCVDAPLPQLHVIAIANSARVTPCRICSITAYYIYSLLLKHVAYSHSTTIHVQASLQVLLSMQVQPRPTLAIDVQISFSQQGSLPIYACLRLIHHHLSSLSSLFTINCS